MECGGYHNLHTDISIIINMVIAYWIVFLGLSQNDQMEQFCSFLNLVYPSEPHEPLCHRLHGLLLGILWPPWGFWAETELPIPCVSVAAAHPVLGSWSQVALPHGQKRK